MSRQISISDEVYQELSRRKGSKSFSEYIREKMGMERDNAKILRFAGALKKDSKRLNELKKVIEKEREANYGREFAW